MHVGTATIFQNPGRARPDLEVYREELRLADLAEPLGFESIWGVEHHFTDYTMCPDVLQFLAYMAGRTERIRLGSMVEYYGKIADKIATYGEASVTDFFLSLQVWGTPEQCYERILDIGRRIGNDTFVGVFSYGGMPVDDAERSQRLFAAEVLPALQALDRAPVAAATTEASLTPVPSPPTGGRGAGPRRNR